MIRASSLQLERSHLADPVVHSHLTKCAVAHTWLRRSREASACQTFSFICLQNPQTLYFLSFSLSFAPSAQGRCRDKGAELSHAGAHQTGASCKAQEPIVCEIPPKKQAGRPHRASATPPPLPVLDKERRLHRGGGGVSDHLRNPLGVNVSLSNWPRAEEEEREWSPLRRPVGACFGC